MPSKERRAIRLRNSGRKDYFERNLESPEIRRRPQPAAEEQRGESAPIITIAAFSARKNSAQRKPKQSARKPATNSASAFGQSNGARFASADPSVTLRACR